IVDAARLVDRIEVRQAAAFTPPPYTLEMLRNDDGVSLIGLIPEGDRAAIADDLDAVGGMDVVDMVEIADYAVPPGWPAAVAFGVEALQILPRSKVSVTEGRVEIEAVSRSPEERVRWLSELERVAPGGIDIVIDISAPRPVITPFTLRFVRTAESARFEACSVDTEAARDRVLDAARAAGLDGPATCQIGLGVPSPRWTQAVEAALTAIAELPEASVTFSDADVTLVAAPGTPRDLFDRVVGDLDAELPAVFSLHGVLPEPDEQSDTAGPPNFTAVLTEDGRIELRGRLPDARIEAAVRAFARAEFGEDVLVATRRVGDLPAGWPARVLAGLGALAELESGTLRVEPERVSITGETGNPDAVSDISRALGEELGEAADFAIDVTYVEALDPATLIPTPEECIDRIETILDLTKITFEPGSVELTAAANSIIDALAAVLPDCAHVEMEIGGHTDSQGRESMNLRLSQSRAEAVLNGLLARDILIGNLSARGYGETRPIADNDTEEGREINRRIEFRLVADVAAENAAFAEAQRLDEIASWPRPVPRPAR
ncbi:MAG: OmpA family protein, partial [Pseudomonadota bacterium]